MAVAPPPLTETLPALQLPGKSVLICGDEIKKLESSVFNHVSLGQWEAARACVNQLAVVEDRATRENTRELLKILIVEAANYWYENSYIYKTTHMSNPTKSVYSDTKSSPYTVGVNRLPFRPLTISLGWL